MDAIKPEDRQKIQAHLTEIWKILKEACNFLLREQEKFYAKLKELEDEIAKNPGHWSPEINLETFIKFGQVLVFND